MSPDPVVVHPDEHLDQAVAVMRDEGVHHLPVVGPGHVLIGLISQRDLLGVASPSAHRVGEIMRKDVKTVAPDTHAHEAAYLLLRYKIGCVPVTESDGRLVGILTDSDFVRAAYTLLGGRVPVDELEMEEEEARRV